MRIHDIAEKGRVVTGSWATSHGNTYGHFLLLAPSGALLFAVVADGEETRFDHVSVSVRHQGGTKTPRCPTWEEMCWIKSLFWDEEDTVIQYHPPRSKYVNRHAHCLHLWKPLDFPVPTPPEWTIG